MNKLYSMLVVPTAAIALAAFSPSARADESGRFSMAPPMLADYQRSASKLFLLDQNGKPLMAGSESTEFSNKNLYSYNIPECDGKSCSFAFNGRGSGAKYPSIEILALDPETGSIDVNPGIREAADFVEDFFTKHRLKGNFFCSKIYKASRFGRKVNSKLGSYGVSLSYDGSINADVHFVRKAF